MKKLLILPTLVGSVLLLASGCVTPEVPLTANLVVIQLQAL